MARRCHDDGAGRVPVLARLDAEDEFEDRLELAQISASPATGSNHARPACTTLPARPQQRDCLPNCTDLSARSRSHLLAVEHELNNRPQHLLGDRTQAELLAALPTCGSPSALRR